MADNKKIEGRSIIHRSTSRPSSHRANSGRRARSLVQEDGRGKRIRAPDSDVISRPSQEGLRVELKSGSNQVAPGDGSELTARAIRGIPPGVRRPQAAERRTRETGTEATGRREAADTIDQLSEVGQVCQRRPIPASTRRASVTTARGESTQGVDREGAEEISLPSWPMSDGVHGRSGVNQLARDR